MYCRHCGQQHPDDAKFCPKCGASTDASETADGRDDVGWLIGGLFFQVLWTRFLWRQPWPLSVRSGLLAAFVAAHFFLLLSLTGVQVAVGVLVFDIVALAFILRSKGAQPPEFGEQGPERSTLSVREIVQSKLASCHDLIAQIEEHTVFDFFPMSSPERRQYLAALEMRAEAMELYEYADTGADLSAADTRATEALDELKSAQDALWAKRDDGGTLPQS